jgi:predicted  nucleic acid-binding Zn-ribbon protein
MTAPRTPPVSLELVRLEREELAISQRREQLQTEIDPLYLRAPLDPEQTLLLDDLEKLERDSSGERLRLHRKIDEVRKQLGLSSWRPQHDDLDA